MGWQDTKNLISDTLALVDGLKNPELREKINQLRKSLLDAMEENTGLREENMELQQQLSDKSEMVFRKPHYWLKKKDGSEDGPFCSKCFDDKNQKIRVREGVTGIWICHVCKDVAKDGRFKPVSSGAVGHVRSLGRNGWMR